MKKRFSKSRSRKLQFETLEHRRVLASISGQVIHDINGSGANDGEVGRNGVIVELLDASEQVVASQTTADNDLNGGGIDPVTERGAYAFTGLAAGRYTVRLQAGTPGVETFVDPAGPYIVGAADQINDVQLGVYLDLPLQLSQLDATVAAVKARWAAAGLSSEQLDDLNLLQFTTADINGAVVQRPDATTVVVDEAPDTGWFVDATPEFDTEFANYLQAGALDGSTAASTQRFDLFSFVAEAMRRDLMGDKNDIETTDIALGVRQLPGTVQPNWWSEATVEIAGSSNWLDMQWTGRQAFIVTNNNSLAAARAQVEIRLDASNFDFSAAQSDGDDLRFTDSDGVTSLSYWIEEYDATDESAIVMVAMPTLTPGEQRTVFAYFGNPNAASASDWQATFNGAAVDNDEGGNDGGDEGGGDEGNNNPPPTPLQPPLRAPIADATRYDAFPGAELLDNGDMLVVFRGGDGHVELTGRILLSRSTDGGNTWNTTTIFDQPGIDDRTNLGLAQLADGTLILPITQYNAIGPTDAFILRSFDNGYTWSAPILVNHQYTKWVYPYGKILERPNGNIEMPVYGEYIGGRRDIAILQSSDQGQTWSRKSTVSAESDGAGFGEMSVVSLENNRYVAVYRYNDQIFQRDSSDAGLTWGAERRLFDGVSPELIRLSSGRLLLCVGDRLDTEGIRCHISDDGGLSWSAGQMVAVSPIRQIQDGGYPASFELANGNVLTSFYYRNTDSRINVDRVIYSPSFVAAPQQQPAPQQPQPQPMQGPSYTYEGVEAGNLNDWVGLAGNTNSASTTQAHNGQFSLEIADADTRILNTAIRQIYDTPQTTGAVTFWTFIDGRSPRGGVFTLTDNASPGGAMLRDVVFELYITSDGSVRYYDGQGGFELPQVTDVSRDEWHKFTFQFDTTSRTAEVFVNGVSRGVIDGFRFSQGVSYFAASSWGTSTEGDILYVDDLYTHSRENSHLQTMVDPNAAAEQRVGGGLMIQGSSAAQDIVVEAGLARHQVQIDGQAVLFDAALVNEIEVDGGDGLDAVRFVGLPTEDSVQLRPFGGVINAVDLDVSLEGLESIIFDGNGGDDIGQLTGSMDADSFTGEVDRALLTGPGYEIDLRNVNNVEVDAREGDDAASAIGSQGDDDLEARPQDALLRSSEHEQRLRGFERLEVDGNGGNNEADLIGVAGHDRLLARRQFAQMRGDGYAYQVDGFQMVSADGLAGSDTAWLFDSADDNHFSVAQGLATMSGPDFVNQAVAFTDVKGFASTGHDTAEFFDSPLNDRFFGRTAYAYLFGPGYMSFEHGFDEVVVNASTGYDTADIFDTIGDDQFIAGEVVAELMGGTGYHNVLNQFDRVVASSRFGGADVAELFDTNGNDTFVASQTSASLSNSLIHREAFGFSDVTAHSNAGGFDEARFIASSLADTFQANPQTASLQNASQTNRANGFDSVMAIGGSVGDQALLVGGGGDDRLLATPDFAELVGPDYQYQAVSFPVVEVSGGGSVIGDSAQFFGSAGADEFESGRGYDLLRGAGYQTRVSGFQFVDVFGGGGADTADFLEAETGDQLLASFNMASLIRADRTSTVFDFDPVRAVADLGQNPTYFEDDVDFLLQRIGNWTPF